MSAVGENTSLRQIAKLVELAENARTRYTSLADRAAQIYAPAGAFTGIRDIRWMVCIDRRHQTFAEHSCCGSDYHLSHAH